MTKREFQKLKVKRNGRGHTHVDYQRDQRTPGVFLPLGQEISNLNITILARLTGTQLTMPDRLGLLPFVLLLPHVGQRATLDPTLAPEVM